MSVIRVNKTRDFTVMSNYHFKDKRLSLKAKGLLSQMLSLPDSWDYTIAGLVAINKENETAIKGALSELKEFGYLTVTKLTPDKTESGRFEYIYDIYEQPSRNPQVEKQGIENLPVESLAVENQGQLNTKQLSTNNKISNINISPSSEVMNNADIWFMNFWNIYPKKVGKANAMKKFKTKCKNEKQYSFIMNALKIQIETTYSKREKKYIPDPATWINQERWNDEIIEEGNWKELAF